MNGLLDVLVGATIGLVCLALLFAGLASGSRALAAHARRGELHDTAALALEAFQFDVRRTGFDPGTTAGSGLVVAEATRFVVTADADGDGSIDGSSAERVTWTYSPTTRRLSRIVGAQSLPLADGVEACALVYRDGAGAVLATPPGGLSAAARATVRTIELSLRLRTGAAVTSRTARATFRSTP